MTSPNNNAHAGNSNTEGGETAAALPLADVTVLEFCHTIMGPSAGLLLADMGANVIKIEPVEGDRTRRLPGFATGFFYGFNRNKRSLAIDLKSKDGLALVQQLARKTDVVLENFAPGTMTRLGCDYPALSAANTGLIFCELKGFLSGPYQHRPALDEVVQFMTGLAYMTGPPGQPLRAGSSVVDIMGGMFAVIAVQAALRERDRTGQGQLVRASLFESAAFLMTQHMAGHAITGDPPPPMPARRGAWAIYETFPTADGKQMFIGITSNNHWRRFCQKFDRQDLLDDSRYKDNEDRVRERENLQPIVAEIAARYDVAELTQVLEEIGLPFSPVSKPEDLFDDPQLNAQGRMLMTEFPNGKRAGLPRLPMEIGQHDFGLRRQAPRVGEHTREVLLEAGLSVARIDELSARGIITVG